jgi:hypothetical protein
MELQQGFGINGMGQRDPFAAGQCPGHFRFALNSDQIADIA